MDKLTQNYFVSGNVLYASELNQLISKINEIIDGSSAFDDSEIQRQLNLLTAAINTEKTRLDGVITDIDNTIQGRINEMLQDAEFLDELKEGIQSSSNFGQQDVDSYLQQIGIITRDGNQLTYGWSTLSQTVDTLSGSVNNLITNGIDQTAVQAAVTASVNDAVANLDLSTMYAKKQAEQVIEWMYSALKQSTGADKTFNEITSAGKNDLQSAISDIRTYVAKLENGDYVSTASLSSAVNTAVSNSIAGLATESYVNSATADVYSQVSTDIGTATAGLATTSYVDSEVSSATAGLMAENDFTSAAVIAKVNNNTSNVKINADQINIDATHQLDLSSQNITVDTSNLQINASNIDFGNGQCQMNGGNLYLTSSPTSNGSIAEVSVVSAGKTNHDNDVSISNDSGLRITCSDSHFYAGEDGGSFRISVGSGYNNSGTGYTGTINGARFVCGICVGQA